MKAKKDNIKRGYLQQILDYFLKPLVRARPSSYTVEEWLERVFHVHDRHILKLQTVRKVRMVGKRQITPQILHNDSIVLKAGQRLLVRYDLSKPKRYEVEIMASPAEGGEQVWTLNYLQFLKLENNLKEGWKRK